MEETKKSSYNGYTDARKEANKRYMENFVEIKVRTTPQHRETVKAHASSIDESVNSFIIRAIDQTMKGDIGTTPSSTNPMLPSDVLKTAKNAAETSGETVPQFIKRAVNAQSERDKTSFRIGLNPVTGEMIRNDANSK